ncbi:DUF1543 domain-containing protein [Prochlorococcus sp. AH-736-L17]|nr:hypothetical protein [Prochlorococcus sp. AH-736-L17]MDA9738164.1 DUF1543 domain-containing protein [Prochlorococcus sp. AH-736-L17]
MHIDSYKKIQYIDGHKINLKNVEKHKIGKKKLVKKIMPKNIYGLSILKAIIQLLC